MKQGVDTVMKGQIKLGIDKGVLGVIVLLGIAFAMSNNRSLFHGNS
ncbi:MAG: hypothetical protein Ct9H300mP18_11760 [Candidatus Neomarinimicrobiota bacterium]|nr:MAG: hypothetical protein Ct9H300mP18_11760 [Candidatus Neomarinimicrobiota bacterium]